MDKPDFLTVTVFVSFVFLLTFFRLFGCVAGWLVDVLLIYIYIICLFLFVFMFAWLCSTLLSCFLLSFYVLFSSMTPFFGWVAFPQLVLCSCVLPCLALCPVDVCFPYLICCGVVSAIMGLFCLR